jgi:hypothetical protein
VEGLARLAENPAERVVVIQRERSGGAALWLAALAAAGAGVALAVAIWS